MGYEFETTTLWKSAFIARTSDSDAEAEIRNYYKVSYLKFREKAALLVLNIPKDLPGLTIHDVTHLDALWETASLIAGETFSLNPAEAFVLGGAILLHDSAMSIASYSNGLAELRETVEWKDIAAAHVKRKGGGISPSDPDIEKLTIPDVLRARHALQAEKLATTAWLLPKTGVQEYIIDDVDLRQFYGPTIGKIARSHWLSVNELEAKLPKPFGAISKAPASWRTDPVKIA